MWDTVNTGLKIEIGHTDTPSGHTVYWPATVIRLAGTQPSLVLVKKQMGSHLFIHVIIEYPVYPPVSV